MKRGLIVLSAVMMLLTGFSVSRGEQGKEEGNIDAKALFENKCIQCHSLDRVKTQKRSTDEWRVTVMRMKNSNGAPISDEEASLIINYLSAAYGKE